MPERCRVILCGFDPMLVRGYVKTDERALWWYLPDELYNDYKPAPGDVIVGKLIAIYDGDGNKVEEPNLEVEWPTTKETGYAVKVPAAAIIKYKLTAFHFIEFEIQKIKKLKGYVEKEIPVSEEVAESSEGEAVQKLKEPVYEEIEVYPGEVKQRKWWPDNKMKLAFKLAYVPPA